MEDGNERAEFPKNTDAWNVERVAEYLGVCPRTVASLVKSKKIPSYKLGKGLRLGKTSKKHAQSMKLRVEEILQDKTFNRAHSSELAHWINGLPPATSKRMVGVGLLTAAPTAMTVEKLIETFLASADVKPSTSAAYQQTTKSLIKSLGAKKMIDKLTSADADTWRKECVAEGLAKATIAKRTNVAKTIFKKAVKLGIIKASPFEDLKVGSQVNSEPRTAKLKRCR